MARNTQETALSAELPAQAAPAPLQSGKPRWRWLAGQEGLDAIADASFEAAVQSRDIRAVDGLAADARGPWAHALRQGGLAGVPALCRPALVRQMPNPIFALGPAGEFLLDERGNRKLAPPISARRLRVACALLDEETGVVFALGFAFKKEKSRSETEIEAMEDAAWAAMQGSFGKAPAEPLEPLSIRMGPLGERLGTPRSQEGNPQSMRALSDLCAAMSPGGFGALLAQTEAAEIAAELAATRPGASSGAQKTRAPGRI